MDNRIINLNEKTKADFKEMAFEVFKPEDAKVYNTLEVPEHYTVVYFVPDHIKQIIINISKEISKIDNSIILNPSDRYHITLLSCPISTNIQLVKDIVDRYCTEHSFRINLDNLVIGALGVAIAGFPESYDFINFRKDLYQETGQEFPNDYRGLACWILLGRFSKRPKQQVVQYVRNHFEQDLGSIEIDSFKILKNHSKTLEGAMEI